jgi:hypothetical protein
MPSQARQHFDANASDIERLLELHQEKGGNLPGRRRGLDVLNKSTIILITSFWEAYCEDIAAEGLEHIVKHGTSSTALPKEIKKLVAKELKSDPNDLAVWALCGDGWKDILNNRLKNLQEQRNKRLNTPKTQNVDELFMQALGLSSVSSSWRWATKMTVIRAREKLDKYVTLRGEIAHRGTAAKTVTKAQVEDYFDFIKKIVSKTGGSINSHVGKVTSIPLRGIIRRRRI